MKQKFFLFAAIAVAAILMLGCVQGGTQPTATPSPTTSLFPTVPGNGATPTLSASDIPALNQSVDQDIKNLADQLK